MGKVKFLKPGLCTQIQDEGRFGYRDIGVAISGAMDGFAYKISNYLVGNNEELASLEITMVGPEIKFYDTELIAICGADLSPCVNGESVKNWVALRVNKGDILSFKGNKCGTRAYLSFAGCMNIPKQLGSFSTNIKASFGGFHGRNIKVNDEINIVTNKKNINKYIGNKLDRSYIPNYKGDIKVRVVLGPQDDYFSEAEINKFFNEIYEVSSLCDRMGYRLTGTPIKHFKSANIISDANNIGSIQVPGDGLPIILMNDCGTTGGYPKIGTVIQSDIFKIAQLKTGDKIGFKLIKIKDAIKIYKEYIEWINEIKEELINKIEDSKYYRVTINGYIYNVNVQEIS